MSRSKPIKVLLVAGGLWCACAAAKTFDLAGSSWRLVQFTSKEGVERPDDPAKYTLHFGTDGRLAVRADCNRGSASWTSGGTDELTIGPVASTRAMCPPGSMSDQVLRDLSNVASAAIKDGRLSLALKMSTVIYEFEVDPASGAAAEQTPMPPAQHAADAAPATKPSFDCTKAAPQSAEQVICADPLLTAMDVELARLYKLATAPKAKSAATIRRDQRTWLQTRDACASQANARTCLRDAYATRITDIRMHSKESRSADKMGISLGPFPFRCEGIEGDVNTMFINAEPQHLVRIQSGAAVWMLDIAPSGSGARYVGPNGELFWNKGREARFSEGDGKPEVNCQQQDTG